MRKFFIIAVLISVSIFWEFSTARLYAQVSPNKKTVIGGNNRFAFDLYKSLSKKEGNFFYSPGSISVGLAMVYAGARGNSAEEMAKVLHFSLNANQLHQAFLEIQKDMEADPGKSGYQMYFANALWGDVSYKFRKEFIGITEKYYDAGLKAVDFIHPEQREESRQTINRWVEEETNFKVKNLVGPDALNKLTRLILIDVIYFKGKWACPFKEKDTKPETFILPNGGEAEVSMMHGSGTYRYYENDSFQILEMPYERLKVSMVVLLPKVKDGLRKMESVLTQRNDLNSWLSEARKHEVILSLPKFKMRSEFSLNNTLESLGMREVFSSKYANFSGMVEAPLDLYLSDVMHTAYVDVNEEGTEALAVTTSYEPMYTPGDAPPQPIVFKADHPFVFLIRDTASGSILFMGRVEDPREDTL